MPMRSDDLYLVDIIESADALQAMTSSASAEAFHEDEILRSAALWQLYILAEAAAKLSSSARTRLAAVPWDDVRAFRNRMAHGYFTLDWARVWEIVRHSVPPLAKQAEALLAESFPEAHRSLIERRKERKPHPHEG